MLCSVRRLLPCCYVPSGGHADGHGGVSAQTCHTLVHSVHRCFMLAMVRTAHPAVHMHGHRVISASGVVIARSQALVPWSRY